MKTGTSIDPGERPKHCRGLALSGLAFVTSLLAGMPAHAQGTSSEVDLNFAPYSNPVVRNITFTRIGERSGR